MEIALRGRGKGVWIVEGGRGEWGSGDCKKGRGFEVKTQIDREGDSERGRA